MSSEYDLFDITSAMDWYEGDGGLLGSKVQARLPEDPFQQELLQGLNVFSAEEQQPSEPAWCSKGLSSSYEMSRTSAASTMIPTDSSMERRHPSGSLVASSWSLLRISTSERTSSCALPVETVKLAVLEQCLL